jgi:hypothetical protein
LFYADRERAIRDATKPGLLHSVDEFINSAIDALPNGQQQAPSREDAVRRMQEFGDKYHLSLAEPVTRTLLHEGHRL